MQAQVYNPSSLPVQAISISLPAGDAGIAKTCAWMKKAASGKEGARNPQIRELALQIVSGVPNRDSTGEVQAIFDCVKANIAFRGEYDETVQTPIVTLRFKAGDCDDHAVLLCALLGALGYNCRFSTVAEAGQSDFTHVYAEVQDRATGQWVPLDTTVQDSTPGWEPGNIARKKSWQALGYLARGPAPMNRGVYVPRGMRGLSAFTFSFGANTDAGDFTGTIGPGSMQMAPRQPVAAVAPPSTTPAWVWPVALVGGGLLLVKLLGGIGGHGK